MGGIGGIGSRHRSMGLARTFSDVLVGELRRASIFRGGGGMARSRATPWREVVVVVGAHRCCRICARYPTAWVVATVSASQRARLVARQECERFDGEPGGIRGGGWMPYRLVLPAAHAGTCPFLARVSPCSRESALP